ncbi:MAG: hypothetical protein ACTHU0_38450 [Kofleriaceae bacterium]
MVIDLDDPIAVMLAASDALERAGLVAVAYGGLTLGMYGEPRETRDADLMVAAADADQARDALSAVGVLVVVAFRDLRFGGNTLTRLSLVGGGQLNTVDLVIPRSPRYAATVLSRAILGKLRGQELRVVAPEDFVILKVLSTRDRDLEDARSVMDKQRGRIDGGLIRDECARLAVEIPDHDISGRLAVVVA